jgi:2,3,4,5-tetrahydropyridine-2,6-dicarboxylate N-succinyltransferase
MSTEEVVVIRTYENGKLVDIVPRTLEHQDKLTSLLSLEHSIGLKAVVGASLAMAAEAGNCRMEVVRSKVPDVFLRMQRGDFSEEVIQAGQDLLEAGAIRTAEKIHNLETGKAVWTPQLYAIDAMNALFKRPNVLMGDTFQNFDKVPLLTKNWTRRDFEERKVRFIPGCFARAGAYIGSGTTLMPGSIVNSGAYIAGDNVMIDGGARVATGAQIGKGVNLGAGSGVEGILEPRGNLPTVVEDKVRVGANCELCGIIEEGAVVASGVIMTKQKKIYDLRTGQFQDPRVIEVGGKRLAVPYIPRDRMAVPGVYMRPGTNIGLACTILLEKPAAESEFTELPKNTDLYVTVR